ncbi:MAG TPA: thioesterase family protein [Longimicrobiaceae bacterium]|nr:thioesterase family protein [Longimicrobiaceae bacterium]
MSEPRLRTAVEIRVRYPETDQMGVVYHAHYLAWCDVGRTELIRGLGKSYAELERDGIFLAVSDVAMRYHAPARYDDRVRVETWVEQVRSRTVEFGYLITRVEGEGPERLVTARITLVALNRVGSPQKLPADMLAALRGALATQGAVA